MLTISDRTFVEAQDILFEAQQYLAESGYFDAVASFDKLQLQLEQQALHTEVLRAKLAG